MIKKVTDFAGSTHFSNAAKVTLAAVIPALVAGFMGHTEIGFNIAIGALLTYPSDIPSNFRHKVKGVLAATALVGGGYLLMNLVIPHPALLYVVLAALIFFLAMISVYGQRATMVSFSGLLSVSLAFANVQSGWDMLQHAGFLVAGGLFYLVVSLLFDLLFPYRYIQLQIAECIRLTAKYMKLRGDLWTIGADRDKIIESQLHLQVELNTIHENLREILIRTRSRSGISNQNRRMLLVFISCVEILELALSTSFDHNKLHKKFEDFPKALRVYQELAYNLASTLKKLSKSILGNKRYVSKKTLIPHLEALEKAISEYESLLGESAHEGVMMLTNMRHYAEKQIEKIKVIERAFIGNSELKDLKERDRNLERLIAPEYYPWRTLRENLSFSSNFFRHSLRLTVTVMAGFVLGQLLFFENAYWILMTIIVIMRPGYGLTRQRSFDRLIGTVAGGIAGFVILRLTDDENWLASIAIGSMLLGFAFTSVNYKIGAGFVTVYVILLYGILVPENEKVVEFRIVDTLVGAALAFVANHFLWPSWEFLSIRTYVRKSIEANRDYLSEIANYYITKGEAPPSYRTSRRIAFVEIGNLMSSFQRMAQEPKSKQGQLQPLYKLVELNHSLLSASASLGTYIQTHHTTKATEAFNVVMQTIMRNLEAAAGILQQESHLAHALPAENIELRFTELRNMRIRELTASGREENELLLQENQLVVEQLVWLISLSESIVKAVKKMEDAG